MWSFNKAYPEHAVSVGEYRLMIGISQLVPRLLEQAVLLKYDCSLNGKDKVVDYSYVQCNEYDFSNYDLSNPLHKEVELLDGTTKKLLRKKPFSSLTFSRYTRPEYLTIP